MAKTGLWEKFDIDGATGETGHWDLGATGEKLRFLIRSRDGEPGVWHAVMSGYSKESSRYRSSLMDERVTWASASAYPVMGEDMRHPGLGLDGHDPAVGYMAVCYEPGVVYNVWDGAGLVFDPADLPVLDPSPASHGNGGERFGPQWAPAPGVGAFVCWTGSGGVVRLRHVRPDGSLGDEVEVGAGRQCTAVAGPDGHLRLVYVADGGLRYRTVEVTPVE